MAKKRIDKVLESITSIGEWALQGISEKEIARRLGISERTLRRYKQEDLSLLTALETGSEKKTREVEYALLQSALGYKYMEEQPQKIKTIYYDENNNKCVKEEVQIVKIERTIPPNVQAQRFWLNNRKEEYWKDNPHKVKNDMELLEIRKKELERNEIF